MDDGYNPRRDGARTSWRLTLWLIAVFGIVLLAASLLVRPAAAQQICVAAEALQDGLADGYGGRILFAGRTPSLSFVVTWSEATGTWSAFTVDGDGIGCMMAAGDGGRPAPPPPPPAAPEKPA